MSFVAAIAFVAACSLGIGLGCGTVEPIHRPPTPAEIDQVNEQSPLVVELLPGTRPSVEIDHVVSADASRILVAPEKGPPYPLRLDEVSHLSSSWGGARSTAIGAGVGAASGALMLWLATPRSSENGGPNLGTVAPFGAALGGTIGAMIGANSRHDFLLVGGPDSPSPSPPPPRPPTPVAKRSASVVAPSAEVHSAPFNVAPVVVVLTQGQRLIVDATAKADWRVAFLSDGRVGYIQDAQVRVDSP